MDMSFDVAAVTMRGFRYDPEFSLPTGLRCLSSSQIRKEPPPEIGLGFLHPPTLHRLVGQTKANLFVWEADRVPPAWIQPLSQHADLIVVPSMFTRDALVHSGLPAEKVAVVTYGYQPHAGETHLIQHQMTKKDLEASDPRFTFLSIVAPHWRKGVRELLQAYRCAFSRGDRVVLVIKSTYDPGEARRRFPFEIPSWNGLIESCGLYEANAPEVDLRLDTISDSEIRSLYERSNVYVAPSWGESFGLAILDALALGIPVIATNWSGHTEFVSPGPDLVPYTLVKAEEELYAEAPDAQYAIPSVDAIVERMRWHYEHPDQSAAKGLEGRFAVSHLTWANATQQLVDVLHCAMDR